MTFDADSGECEECEEDSFADDGTFFTVNIYIFSFRALLALLLPRVLSLSFGRLASFVRACLYV